MSKELSRICNLPKITVAHNCIDFKNVDGELISDKSMLASKFYVLFEDEIYQVEPFNKPTHVNWLPIVKPYRVNHWCINHPVVTGGVEVALKFFVHRGDWYKSEDCNQTSEYIDDLVKGRIIDHNSSKIYYAKVLIDEVKNDE